MYARANDVLIRKPDLYLVWMIAIALAPWLVLAVFKPAAALFAGAVLAIFALYLFAPFASTAEDAFQKRIERSYRLVRAGVYTAGLIVCTLIAWAWPGLVDRDALVVFAAVLSGTASMNLGQHARFRWLMLTGDIAG